MLRSRFLWKLYAVTVLVILLVSFTVGGVVARRITAETREDIQTSLRDSTVLLQDLAYPVLTGVRPAEGFQAQIRDLGARANKRFTVLTADGTVIADSDKDPALLDRHDDRPEILEARASGEGFSERFSESLQSPMTYHAFPVIEDGEVRGFVRSALSLAAVDERLRSLRNTLLLGGLIATLLALLLGFLISRQLTAPLVSMTTVANSIAAGDYDRRVRKTGKDEVGQLAEAFNVMAGHLHDRVETITRDRNKLRAVLGGMVEGVVAVDQEQNVVHMNDVAAGILGVAPEQCVGRKIWEVTRVLEVSEILARTLETSAEQRSNFRKLAGSHDRIVEMHSSPLRDGEGRSVGAVVVLHDITELERLEAVRRDFVANVSHELKTPITAIRGMAETLVEDPEMPEETRSRFIDRIREQTYRLSSLVVDLLTLARLESENGGIVREPLDFGQTVRSSMKTTVPEDGRIRVHLDLPEEPISLLGDEEALRQVINNLLGNAVKYTPEGGRVEVRLRREGKDAVLEVTDTGVGIEPVHLDRIFERFYRVDKARSRELGGTGLGLSIVKHVCRAHGGDVSVKSAPGRGSTFTVRLPIRESGV